MMQTEEDLKQFFCGYNERGNLFYKLPLDMMKIIWPLIRIELSEEMNLKLESGRKYKDTIYFSDYYDNLTDSDDDCSMQVG